MGAPHIPIYLDWTFWAFVVAALALLSSLFPALRLLAKRGRIQVEVHDSIFLSHIVGNPSAQLYIIVRNIGGRRARISAIDLEFQRENGEPFLIPARGYFENAGDKNPIMFTPFNLAPGQEWGHILNCFVQLPREEARELAKLISNLRADIKGKRSGLPKEAPDVPADDANVTPLMSACTRNFKWRPGEYRVTVITKSETKFASTRTSSRITIFESESTELGQVADGYRTGKSILFSGDRDWLLFQMTRGSDAH
jgi:hypothetical protein